jgi:retron-type reverse transcriptase
MKEFLSQWCGWIETIIQGGHVRIKINDQVGQNFQTKKGLRQGGPLSPLLFNIVVGMLVILIKRAKLAEQFNGVVPHLVDDGLSILQYADDTIIFLDHDLEKAKNLKVLLCAFEKLSGLKINFLKSQMYCFGEAKEMESEEPSGRYLSLIVMSH